MGKLVTVNPGYQGVILPPQNLYFNAGQTQTLTDAEYAGLPTATLDAIVVTTSGLPDPARPSIIDPVSLADAVNEANAYTNTAVAAIPTGPAGPTGLNGRGPWSVSNTYATNDYVSYNGSSYYATAGVTTTSPGTPSSPATPWALLVQQGTAGTSGGTVNPMSFAVASSTITPSATINTNGTPATVTYDAGFTGIPTLVAVIAAFGGTFSSETATVSITPTYSDTTTGSPQTLTSAATGNVNGSATTLFNLLKSGVRITSISVVMQSNKSGGSSAANCVVKFVGVEA